MMSLVVLGARGFLGMEIIATAAGAGAEFVAMPIKAVARSIPNEAESFGARVTWVAADLLAPASLDGVFSAGDVVINLAFELSMGQAENLRLVDNIVTACIEARVARLVHCSTAVVAGAARTSPVTESTICEPLTPYEQTKWTIEQHVLAASASGLDVGILRPTAIVGPGGQNLLKLATALRNGSWFANYCRASLFGRRPMNLVPVRNVVNALLHLAALPEALDGSVYIVSSDDDDDNNFRCVEEILLDELGLAPRWLPLVPIPRRVLALLLKLRGRSAASAERVYESRKLLAARFEPIDSVATAVRDFARHFRGSRR